jgi:hypothetical protein
VDLEICTDTQSALVPFLATADNTHAKLASSHSTNCSGAHRYRSEELVVVELAVGNAGSDVDVLEAVAVSLVISDAVESEVEEEEEGAAAELEVLLCATALVASRSGGRAQQVISRLLWSTPKFDSASSVFRAEGKGVLGHGEVRGRPTHAGREGEKSRMVQGRPFRSQRRAKMHWSTCVEEEQQATMGVVSARARRRPPSVQLSHPFRPHLPP